jgi:hypothetical protein
MPIPAFAPEDNPPPPDVDALDGGGDDEEEFKSEVLLDKFVEVLGMAEFVVVEGVVFPEEVNTFGVLLALELDVVTTAAATVAFEAQAAIAESVLSHMITIPFASIRIELDTVAVGTRSRSVLPVTVISKFVMCSPLNIERRHESV